MANPTNLLLLLFFFISINNSIELSELNVVDFGAKPDGETDSTSAFLKAWSVACGSSYDNVTFLVPEGIFLVKSIVFRGPCKSDDLLVIIDGTIIAPSDFNELKDSKNWIQFLQVDGVTIQGGVLDAKGTSLWDCKATSSGCPAGTTTLSVAHSRNVIISGLTSKDSEMFHIHIFKSKNVSLEGVTVSAPEKSPNTDGIHVSLSKNVTISDSNIATGDDCISISQGSSKLRIQNITCGPGHGISIGSLGYDKQEKGVKGVNVTNVSFSGSTNGFRIKTWGRPSKAYVKDVIFQHATMDNVRNPIIIDQHYCSGSHECSHQDSGVKVSNIKYYDIHGTSATKVAMRFNCSQQHPCNSLHLEDVDITSNYGTPQSACENAYGVASGTINPKCCIESEDKYGFSPFFLF